MRALVAVAFATLALPGAAAAQSLEQTCELALVKADAAVLNAAFPDASASYWLVSYRALPGTRLRIRGQYPHARYMSFNVYDPAARPLDALNDTQIAPDPGSTNPFMPEANRTAVQRDYSLTVEFGMPPEDRAANTIYTGQGQSGTPNVAGTLIYRLYVPDDDRGEFGGVGLPRVTLEAGEGGAPISPAECREVSLARLGLNDQVAGASGLPELERLAYPGYATPVWRRFVNVATAYADGVLDTEPTRQAREAADNLPLAAAGGRGGMYSNIDNDYVYAPTSRGHGQVLVLRAKAPTFADTRAGAETMPKGSQLRYFSICQNDAYNTRFVACLRDDELVLDEQGYFTIAVSTAAQRPASATTACGVNWMPWGPNFEGVLIYRHMLPDRDFAHAIQRLNYGDEEPGLGEYYPRGVYQASPAAFDASRPCSARSARAHSSASAHNRHPRFPRNP